MTLAMAWGLVSGTILALMWVPCAYAIVEDMTGLLGKLFGRKQSGQDETETIIEEKINQGAVGAK